MSTDTDHFADLRPGPIPRPGSAPITDPERVPLGALRVAGTPIEKSLERIVSGSAPGRVAVAAFSSSI